MKPEDFENFVFDLDGPLFILPVDWLAVRNELAALTKEPIDGTPLFQKVQQILTVRPALRESVLHLVESHELKAIDSLKPLPGAAELVSSLFEVGRLALVTLQSARVCNEILAKHKMLDLFEAVVTREDSLDRATQLEAALNRLGVRPRDALFVGDRLNDVVCARRVGVPVALVGRAESQEPRPDFSFPTLLDLRVFFP
jgi:phosphoglycolate phosphatase